MKLQAIAASTDANIPLSMGSSGGRPRHQDGGDPSTYPQFCDIPSLW